MTSRAWNILGLLLGMLGVGFLFKWGPPQPPHETGISLGLEDNTPIDGSGETLAEHNKAVEARRQFYTKMSRLGLCLIFLGFFCQLVAAWCPNSD